MEVISITPRGYCKGVTKAIQAVKNAYYDPTTKKPIYVLGYIVHNKHVIHELEELGVITLDDRGNSRLALAESIESGTVVLSAHGTDPAVKLRLEEKGIPYIDATCEDVDRTFDLIKEYSNKGYTIFYIGKHKHPEAVAATSLCTDIHLIEQISDIPHTNEKPIFVTNQTTFSLFEIKEIIHSIIERYPNTLISEEICDATRLRQDAIIQANVNVDLCYIVGDPRSNNTKNLALISENITNTKTKLIETVADIDIADLIGVNRVSVSSGASTPSRLTKEVIDFLKNQKPLN